MNSKRRYEVIFFEDNASITPVTLDYLMKKNTDCYEWVYAAQERIDEIIDLPIRGQISMPYNRDNPETLMIIYRVA